MEYHGIIKHVDKCTAIDRLLQYTGFLNDFIVFRERGREGKREGARETSIGCLHMPPNGDLAHNPGMCRLEIEPLGCSLPGTGSTEPHQSGLQYTVERDNYIPYECERQLLLCGQD